MTSRAPTAKASRRDQRTPRKANGDDSLTDEVGDAGDGIRQGHPSDDLTDAAGTAGDTSKEAPGARPTVRIKAWPTRSAARQQEIRRDGDR